MSSVVNVKQVKVLCLNYVPTWWEKLSQLWMYTRTFHKCANIYPDPCDVFEYFMILHKYKNSRGSSLLKEFFFPTVNLCLAVIKYPFKIFGHLFYYFYQLCSLFRLLFPILSISTIWHQIQKLWALIGHPTHWPRILEKLDSNGQKYSSSKEASRSGYLWGEQLEGKGVWERLLFNHLPFSFTFCTVCIIAYPKVHIIK